MKKQGCLVAFAMGCLMSVVGADVEIDFGKTSGPMLPLHGVCNSPLLTKGVQDTFRDAGIPFMRPHDACGAFGGAHYIDIPNLFPDFSIRCFFSLKESSGFGFHQATPRKEQP